MSSPICVKILKYECFPKNFLLLYRQFFQFITLKQTIFFSQLQLANNFFYKKGTPPIKNNGPSLTSWIMNNWAVQLEMISAFTWFENRFSVMTICLNVKTIVSSNHSNEQKGTKNKRCVLTIFTIKIEKNKNLVLHASHPIVSFKNEYNKGTLVSVDVNYLII